MQIRAIQVQVTRYSAMNIPVEKEVITENCRKSLMNEPIYWSKDLHVPDSEERMV